MVKKPSNKLIAEVSGLTEGEVGTYLCQLDQQASGDWLAYFGNEIEKVSAACQKLNKAKTVTIPVELANNWYDRGNG
ncbi:MULTISPECIES: hypothetical protein [Pseudomonas]|jgi:hypothetical protein|uniref:Uncharacterized protein n=1 Tax=Pseudomonas fluorescens TaxID=294 RepID=A0A5E6V3S6_PSEFL|nr:MULTISPECIES: hypothetical protein [Pseudomonas]VVN12682.1 hypothetical protein PS673_03881 [Pseudomonas fluorescens]